MASYRVEPRPEWGGYVVLRPDGSTLCVVCAHCKAVAICSELERLRLALHSACTEVTAHMYTAWLPTTPEEQVAYHLARTEAMADA